jgi:hypothetical protein
MMLAPVVEPGKMLQKHGQTRTRHLFACNKAGYMLHAGAPVRISALSESQPLRQRKKIR